MKDGNRMKRENLQALWLGLCKLAEERGGDALQLVSAEWERQLYAAADHSTDSQQRDARAKLSDL